MFEPVVALVVEPVVALVFEPVVALVVALVVELVVAPVVAPVVERVRGLVRENHQVGGLPTLDRCISIGSACRAISSSAYGLLGACASTLSWPSCNDLAVHHRTMCCLGVEDRAGHGKRGCAAKGVSAV